MRRGSLALRISLLAVAVAVVTALIGGLIAERSIKAAAESGARQSLSQLAGELQADVDVHPSRDLPRLRALRIDSGSIGPEGRVVATSPRAKDSLTKGQIQTVLSGGSVSAVQTVDGQETLVEARPTTRGGIFVVEPRAQAASAVPGALGRLVVALGIAGLVAVVLGLIVSWRLSRPLKAAAAAAHRLAGGERGLTVPVDGPAEVAEVASALNTLGASLEVAESRQRDFLLSVSHDLRTPLTAISGYAESLSDGMIEASHVPKVGSVLLAEAKRLERLVADLLDLARLDAPELRIDSIDIDLVVLLSETAAAWAGRCQQEGVQLLVETPSVPLHCCSDPVRLRQVIDGLVENALRVVPAGGPIVLVVRAERDSTGQLVGAVEVRDGGPGLTDTDLTVAFERSALYDRYRGVRRVGTGLGLAIVARLVSRLDGTVEAGHAAEGGARFTVRLPADRPFVDDPVQPRGLPGPIDESQTSGVSPP